MPSLAGDHLGGLRSGVRVLATQLRALGVQPGDRVAAYMPNIPETVTALLACGSIGAVWSGPVAPLILAAPAYWSAGGRFAPRSC